MVQLKRFYQLTLLSATLFGIHNAQAVCEQKVKNSWQQLITRLVETKCPEITHETYPQIHATIIESSKKLNIVAPRVFLVKHNSLHCALVLTITSISPEYNALVYSLDAQQPVILMDPRLLTLLTEKELTGILGHELSHIVYDVSKELLWALNIDETVEKIASLMTDCALLTWLFLPKYRRCAFLSALGCIATIFGAKLWHNYYIKLQEYKADARATKLVQEKTWINGVRKQENELGKCYPFSIKLLAFVDNHPSFQKREKAIEQMKL